MWILGPEGSSAPRAERGDCRQVGEQLLRGLVRSWPGAWISSSWPWGVHGQGFTVATKVATLASEGEAIGRQDQGE